MSRPISVGYLTLPSQLIEASAWLVTPSAQAALTNPESIASWQYSTDLVVARTLTVNLARIADATNMNVDDEFRCVITWSSTVTGVQGSSRVSKLTHGANELSVKIPGSWTGGTIKLRTIITCGSRGADRHPLAPRRPGSVMWSDDHQILVEGDLSRFPTEAMSFNATGVAQDGTAWFLDVNTSDLAAPALSAVRLVLNTDHPAYERLNSTPVSPEAAVTRQFLMYDIARQLVAAGLAEEELTNIEYERGTIGNILRARLSGYFGDEGEQVEPLRERWKSSPWDVDAELQAFFEL